MSSSPTPVTAFVPAADVGVLDSPEEVLTTLRSDGKRKWMYPSESRGRFWRRRQILGTGTKGGGSAHAAASILVTLSQTP